MREVAKILIAMVMLSLSSVSLANEALDAAITSIQTEWAEIKYRAPEEERADKLKALAEKAEKLAEQYPNKAEPLIWRAISLGTYAGAVGGLSSLFESLPAVKKAKVALEKAMEINPEALDGAGVTTLGGFYYQVPGWPIAYGDKDKARELLERGLVLNPNGVDANYFYGDFLVEEGEYKKAKEILEKALNAPPRPGRKLADEGRKEEARQALQKAEKHL